MLKKITLLCCFLAGTLLAQTVDLPIVFIDTKGECLDNTVNDKMPATMSVLDAATNNVADSAKGTHYDIGIKVRGQSSAKFPKPGYSVEIRDDKGEGLDVSMLGLPPADDWVFHGPYVDKSLMRNALAHWLFRQAGHYSPRTKHFDLYINGVYRGVYVLIEKIKRGKYRVDVSKLKETDISGDDVTGGYIWAFDKTGTNTGGMGTEDINKEGFKTADGLNVIMHYPKKENLQQQQQAYLKKYLEDRENLFKNGQNGSGYENYVDMTSALDYVLHEEVTNNSDSYWCSFFLHKP
ncbi:MAG: CotH kinase family protein, partial [Fibrobacter sp.]|nr:CotH kinase family protein [Fibrobacter sp.]